MRADANTGMKVSVVLMYLVSLMGLALFAVDLAIGVSWPWYLIVSVLCLAVGAVATGASVVGVICALTGESRTRRIGPIHALASVLFILVLCLSWMLFGLKRSKESGAVFSGDVSGRTTPTAGA